MSRRAAVGAARWVLGGHALSLAAPWPSRCSSTGCCRQPEELRRLVAERTAELERAHESQRAAEDALRQGQKLEAIGRLAGGIAHDFNNLLHVVIGYVDSVSRRPDVRPAERDDLAKALAAADRAAALTRQLLAFGRRQVLEPTALDLNVVVSDIMKLVSRILGEHVELQVVPGQALGTIWADRAQVEQVILNLCVNARDAMPDGGRLVIETENVQLDASRPRRPGRVEERSLRAAPRVGHRCGHRPRRHRARLRALLHHQGTGSRHRASAWPPCTASFTSTTAGWRWRARPAGARPSR